MCSSGTHWLRTAMRDGAPLSVIILAHLPLVMIHFSHLWQTGLHAHFPLILAVVGGVLWSRWSGNRTPGRWQIFGSGILLAGGFLILLFSVLIWSPWLGYVGTLVTAAAVLLRVCPSPVKEWAAAWLLLWLLVPLPMGLDRHISLELQRQSTQAASLLLDFFHVNHLRTGNMIVVPGIDFSVEEACSGVHSLFVLISAAAILAVLLRHWWLHAVALLASSVVWAIAANMVRVAGVVIAVSRFGIDLSAGWRHELWGIVLFGIAFLMILSTDRILWLLLGPSEEPYGDKEENAPQERDARSPALAGPDSPEVPTNDAWDDNSIASAARLGVFQSWTVAGMFACLGLMQTVPRSINTLWHDSVPAIRLALGEESLSAELGGWQRIRFETEHRGPGDTNGEFSAIWRYKRGGREAVVSLDYPFDGWHQLTECYRSRGCRVLEWHLEPVTESRVTECDSPAAGQFAVTLLEMERARTASLLFAEWNAEGVLLAPPVTEGPTLARLMTDLKRRWSGFSEPDSVNRCVYQLQVLSPSTRTPSTANDALALRQLFSDSLCMLRQRTAVAAGGVP